MHKEWSKIISIDNWSFLSFKYLFLHWIIIFPTPPSLVYRMSCSCPEWLAAGGGSCLLLKQNFWANEKPRMTMNLQLGKHDTLWSQVLQSFCWYQKTSGLLIFSPGSRQGCALRGTVFYLALWSTILPVSPSHSWDATVLPGHSPTISCGFCKPCEFPGPTATVSS